MITAHFSTVTMHAHVDIKHLGQWLPFIKEDLVPQPVAYLANGVLPRMRFTQQEPDIQRLALIPLIERDTVEITPVIDTEEPMLTVEIPQESVSLQNGENQDAENAARQEPEEEEVTPESLLILFKKQVEAGTEVDMPFVLPSQGDLVDPNNLQRIRSRYRLEP